MIFVEGFPDLLFFLIPVPSPGLQGQIYQKIYFFIHSFLIFEALFGYREQLLYFSLIFINFTDFVWFMLSFFQPNL